MCAELCAEIRYEYRLFLANLCLSVHREDLIPWCFEYTPGPPPSTLLPLSWQSGTTIFATSPRHITADGDTSQQPLQRVFLVGDDLVAASTNKRLTELRSSTHEKACLIQAIMALERIGKD